MADIEKKTSNGVNFGTNLEITENILRILTLLEQRLNQVARKNITIEANIQRFFLRSNHLYMPFEHGYRISVSFVELQRLVPC